MSTTEVRDVLSREALIQLILQHFHKKGFQKSLMTLEQETGVKYNGMDSDVSFLTIQAQMGVKESKNVYQQSESIFKDDIYADTEVPTASIYKHIAEDDGNMLDITTHIWKEGPEKPGENILFIKGTDEMRAASLNKLVERLTPRSNQDLKYVKTFLVTYRSFTTPEVLLMKMLERFDVPDIPPEHLASTISDNEWQQQILQIKLRVGNILKQWVHEFIYDFNQTMLRTLNMFIEDKLLKHPNLSSLGLTLKKNLDKKLMMTLTSESEVIFERDPPYPIVPKNIFTAADLTLFDIDDTEIARQFTIRSHNIYRKIKPEELLNQAWSKDKLKHRAPNVLKIKDDFNLMSAWVATSIVSPEGLNQRRARMQKIIKVCEKLRMLNNFHALLAFCSGLQSVAIHRLTFTREAVGPQAIALLDSYVSLMKAEKSYKDYRTELLKIDPPVVPYLGIYQTDITFIEDGNPDWVTADTGRDLINYAKRKLVYNVIQEVQQYQQKPYNLQPVYQIQALIEQGFKEVLDDENLYQLSLQREKRGADRNDIKL